MRYDDMSVAQLEVEINGLNNDMSLIRDTKAQIAKILDKKLVLEEALRKLERMSIAERAALAQVLNPNGIVSQEQHGVIGRMLKALRGT